MAGNPKKAINALAAVGSTVGAIRLHELTPSTFVVLEKIGSPLSKAKPGEKVTMNDMDILRLIYILAFPSRQSFELIESGSGAFDAAVIEFGDSIPRGNITELTRTVTQLLSRSMSTVPSSGSDAKKKGAPLSTMSPPKAPAAAGS